MKFVKFLVVAVCLFAVAAAAPPSADMMARRKLPALEHEEVHDEFGQYALRYVTAEGTVVSERGRLVPNNENTGYVMVVEGEVSYIGDNGKTYVTKYSAGLDGTHAEGAHLPVPVEAEPVEVVPVPVAEVPAPVAVVSAPLAVPAPLVVVPAPPVVPGPVPIVSAQV